MLRAMWTGSISFGLVAIPVKAITAQRSQDIRFELLHRTCNSKLQTRKYCPQCEREVEAGEIVRGYQYRKGDYVLFEPEELEGLATPAKHTLRILDFVDMAEVDPVYYEKPYYLQPAPGGERTYALLHQAMKEKGKVGIGKVAFREREHLALIRPVEHALVLETIAFPDEVRALDEAVPPFETEIEQRELQMATLLIDNLSAHFDPRKYTDDYREALEKLIQAKVEGGTIHAAPQPAAGARGEVLDLMEMLRRSVEAAQEAPEEAATAAEEKPKARRPKKAA